MSPESKARALLPICALFAVAAAAVFVLRPPSTPNCAPGFVAASSIGAGPLAAACVPRR